MTLVLLIMVAVSFYCGRRYERARNAEYLRALYELFDTDLKAIDPACSSWLTTNGIRAALKRTADTISKGEA